MSAWTNFFIVISVQMALFFLLAYKFQALKKITFQIVGQSIVLGIVIGTIFDLIVGKYIGVFDYVMHFSPWFLILNGAFSYGLWVLTVWLLQSKSLMPFCAWTILIGLVYEVSNYFFRVWYWTFGHSFLYREALVILVAYCGLALVTAIWMSITMKVDFHLI